LFPKIEKIIPVRQYTGGKMGMIKKNRYLKNLAKKIIKEEKPDIVISDNDMCAFELYLFRYAKRKGAKIICFQAGFLAGKMKEISYALNLVNAYLKAPKLLYFLSFKFFWAKTRKYLGHFLYYWILPLFVGELPFLGKSSVMIWKGNVGLRGADYYLVFSERDYQSVIADGVPAKKLGILPHPLARNTKMFFEKVYFSVARKIKNKKNKVFTIMWTPEEISFKKENFALISKKEMEKNREEIIALIVQILKNWKIYIKPHPDTPNFEEMKKKLKLISKRIEVVNPLEPADKYIEISDVIASFPPGDTVIFTSLLQHPEKPILSLDLDKEAFGDIFLHESYRGVDYISNKEELVDILKKIAKGSYVKKYNKRPNPEGFLSAVDAIKQLYAKTD
jgi:hypothetical protein